MESWVSRGGEREREPGQRVGLGLGGISFRSEESILIIYLDTTISVPGVCVPWVCHYICVNQVGCEISHGQRAPFLYLIPSIHTIQPIRICCDGGCDGRKYLLFKVLSAVVPTLFFVFLFIFYLMASNSKYMMDKGVQGYVLHLPTKRTERMRGNREIIPNLCVCR